MFLFYIFLFINLITSQNPIVNTGIECEDNYDCTNFCDLGIIYNTKCSYTSYIYGYNDTQDYNITEGYYVQYCSYNENKPILICDKGCSFKNNFYECNLNCPSLNPCLYNSPYICNNDTLYQNIFNTISNECNYLPLYNCSDFNLKCSTNSLNISMCYSVSNPINNHISTTTSISSSSSSSSRSSSSSSSSTSSTLTSSTSGIITNECDCLKIKETSSANKLNIAIIDY